MPAHGPARATEAHGRIAADDESDDLDEDDAVPDLADGNAAVWRPLCSRLDRRYGEYHLDLAKARDTGTDQLAN